MTTTPPPKGDLQVRIGQRFRAVRQLRGVSLREMADVLHCALNTVRWHENGARMLRADAIVAAAEHLNVSSALILGEGEVDDLEERTENVVSE